MPSPEGVGTPNTQIF